MSVSRMETVKTREPKPLFEFDRSEEVYYRGKPVDTGHLSARTVKELMVYRRILLEEGGYGFGGVSTIGKNGDSRLVVWAFDGALRKFQLISVGCQTLDEAKTTLDETTRMFGD